MESRAFPWWIGIPASAGLTLMGIFATNFLPLWAQAVLFAGGAAAVVWSIVAGAWHYRLRWGASMASSLLMIAIGLLSMAGGVVLAWQGLNGAQRHYRPHPSGAAPVVTRPPDETKQAPGLPRAIPPTSEPAPPPIAGPSASSPPSAKPAFDLGEARATVRGLWDLWLDRDGLTSEELSRLVLPPDDWMNERLANMGRPYRVKAQGAQFTILAVEGTANGP